MSTAEKAFYGLLLLAATTFGGIVYKNALDRVSVLEAFAQEVTRDARSRDTILSGIVIELRFSKDALDRIERRLELVPPKTVSTLPSVPLKSPLVTPLESRELPRPRIQGP